MAEQSSEIIDTHEILLKRVELNLGDDWITDFWPEYDSSPSGANASTPGTPYLAIPKVRSPRYLLPRGRKAAASAMRHFNSSGSVATQIRNLLMRSSLRTLGALPGRSEPLQIPQAPGAPHIVSYLSALFEQPVRISMYFGPPRANRKPILQVMGVDNTPLAFVKVGINEVTRRLVRREAEALRRLSRYRLDGIEVPRPIHAGQWNGLETLVVTPLPTWRAQWSVPAAERFQAMLTVSKMAGTARRPLAGSSYLAQLSEKILAVRQDFIAEPLQDIIDTIAAHSTELTFGSWHGDWTQWNMAKADSKLLVWDWERFETDVPVGFDALHYAARVAVSQDGPTQPVASQLVEGASNLLAHFGIASREAATVASLYLIDLALRYTLDAQRDAGGRSGKVEEWVIPALRARWTS